ncbi:hypothetical protein [Helicobacter turcicus]|uniref:Uncharacterized protein n=1 Tax=Helicobacter turcicus TaxID=2867412 RepID=A0ABS7JPW3_9HELI|nr:hypothetical protein [Helicobacter turcicus]MBX7491408.1 hypothetical protein [Helicobacter turcicus]MBX7546275.1 hypothetical protein [Helicobacter turcicus]
MLVNHSLNASGLNEIFNEANRLLDKETQTAQSTTNTQNINKISLQNNEQDSEFLEKERITYGLISLEIMSNEQYKAFERVTANMSPNEKIAVAQILTRAGNLSASVEHIREQERAIAEQNTKSAQSDKQGFLGVTQDGWKEVAKEFQENLNNLDGIYTKSYNKNLTSNYNDILRKNGEAKTQRILREFSHAIYSGNIQIDTIG